MGDDTIKKIFLKTLQNIGNPPVSVKRNWPISSVLFPPEFLIGKLERTVLQ